MKNKVLKRFLSVLLCVCVFCCTFTATTVFADDLSDVLDTNYSSWDDLPSDFQSLGQAYYQLVSGTSDINSFFKNASEIPLSWFKVLRDGTAALSPVNGILYFLDNNGDLFVENQYSGGGGGSHHAGAGRGDVVISSEVFKDHITETNSDYTPKNAIGKMSFRTDDFFHGTILKNDTKSTQYNYWFLYTSGQGFRAIGGGNEIYLQFFFTYGGNTYYSQYQYHFTMNTEDVWFSDRDEVEYTKYQLAYEYWDFMYSDENSMQSGTMFTDKDCEYFRFQFTGDQPYIVGFSDYSKFSTYTYSPAVSYYIPGLNTTKSTPFYSSDRTTSINFGDGIRSHFVGAVSKHDQNCENKCDIGYIASATPIKSTYDIDVSRIPDNYFVTINGDTVYDYSITNPETGQTSTINEYVTNNYTYITNNNGNESGSGVGNVTVGGHIDVGGKVDVGVDINVSVPDINININGGGSGGSSPGQSYDLPNTDIFNSYYDAALDDSSDLRDFLSSFFSFLPPEIILLLGIGLTFVILARIFGR